MKTIHKHLRVKLISLIAFTLSLTHCKKETETVFITPKISVELPNNYEYFISHSTGSDITNPGIIYKYVNYKYKASINNDEINISNTITNEFDTLDMNEKKAKLKNGFIKGFARGFNGNILTNTVKETNGLAQSEFTLEIKKNDSLSCLYGRFMIQDTNLIYLGYITKLPASKRSIREKDNFFKSIKFN